MAQHQSKEGKRKLLKRLKSRYRLVLINEVTFDERFSAYLKPLNVIAAVAFVFIVIAALVVSVIVFTPLKEYIPGYSDTQTRIKALQAAVRADSLADAQRVYEQYFTQLNKVLSGEVYADTVAATEAVEQRITYDALSNAISREDSILRSEIESEERFALNPGAGFSTEAMGLPGVFFFPPLRGVVLSSYNAGIGHYGVDIAAPEGSPISAVYAGTITLSSFTSDAGYVIHIQHPNNLVSAYKHNSSLLKNVGDRVEAGDIIAILGNTGEHSDGPHLHFELWYNGNPLDPQEFIAFSK